MLKANDIMTRALVVCEPDTSTAGAAELMRDRNIGDVLVVNNGELLGIVTDRDLATKALTSRDDPRETPVRKYMSEKVVVGEPGWNLDHVSEVMAKHKIRRLPIVDHGHLAGLVSLGDVAVHFEKKNAVAKSLRAISEPASGSILERRGISAVLAGLAVAITATTVIAMRTRMPMLSDLRKQRTQKRMVQNAKKALTAAKDALAGAATDERVQSMTDRMRSRIKLAI
jgi:CBS domain-containing protein